MAKVKQAGQENAPENQEGQAPENQQEQTAPQQAQTVHPGKVLIDKVEIDEDIAKQVDEFAKRAQQLAEVAYRADRAQERAKNTVSAEFLQIARDCNGDLRLFNQSCILAQYRFKAAHKTNKVPRLWTQVQSNIRYILENGRFVKVDVNMIDPETKKPYSLAKLYRLVKKREEDQTQQTAAEQEAKELAATPRYVKDFREIVQAMEIEAQIKEGTWREEFRPMIEATAFMRDTLRAWRDQNKEKESDEDLTEPEKAAAAAQQG